MNDLIDYIKNTMRKFAAETTDKTLQLNEFTIAVTRYFERSFILLIFPFAIFYFIYMIQREIRFWCEEYVDTIFIVGYPYFSDKHKIINYIRIHDMFQLYENKNIRKVDKIITKQIDNKSYEGISEIMARLEPKFHR